MSSFIVVVAWMAAAASVSVSGKVYKVGDSAGWTTLGNIDYKGWAATKAFQLGDTVVFEYNAQFHNVMQVSHAEYRACNTTAPKATYTTGNDSITLTKRGHHYYFCGVPGHCQEGQKVDINVPRLVVRAPSPSELVSPVIPASQAQPPTANDGVTTAAADGDSILRFLLSSMVTLANLWFTLYCLG